MMLFASLALAGGGTLRLLAALWFVRWRGTVVGLLMIVPGFDFIVSSARVDTFWDDWRTAPRFGALAGVAIAVIALIFLRSHPGKQEAEVASERPLERRPVEEERSLALGAYLRNKRLGLAFLAIGLAAALLQGAKSSLLWYLYATNPAGGSWLAESASVIAHGGLGYPVGVYHLGAVFGRISGGIAADLLGYRRPMAIAVLAVAVAAVLFMLPPSGPPYQGLRVNATLVLAGLGMGGMAVLATIRFIDVVGVRLLGTFSLLFAFLSGLCGLFLALQSVLVEAGSSNPNYGLAHLITVALLPVVAAVILWLTPLPKLGPQTEHAASLEARP